MHANDTEEQQTAYNINSFWLCGVYLVNCTERCRSACASAQSDLRATLSAHKLVSETVFCIYAESVALRSDCLDAQADLELHCPHMTI